MTHIATLTLHKTHLSPSEVDQVETMFLMLVTEWRKGEGLTLAVVEVYT